MHSPDNFVAIDTALASEKINLRLIEAIRKYLSLDAILICKFNDDLDEVKVCLAMGLAMEPFNGSLNYAIKDVIDNCFSTHPAPHIHSIANLAIANLARRHCSRTCDFHKAAFIPVKIDKRLYVALLFIADQEAPKKIPDEAISGVGHLITHFDGDAELARCKDYITVTELYIKEVGHDIATCVQATIAKAHNIEEGRIPASALASKAREIEAEILSISATAENLGIAIDPIFKVKDVVDFDLLEVIKKAIGQYSAEANERHLQIIPPRRIKPLFIWGEEKAIQFCLHHLLLNAIKYSFGGNNIEIDVSETPVDVCVSISNSGMPLPEGDELKNIWGFGIRGKRAKELHVNGSGIGLYTVKKVVNAHYGTTLARKTQEKTIFSFTIAKKQQLQRAIGLLC